MSGLYIHIPFCIKKCFYCDFYSIENLTGIDKLIDSLCREIRLRAEQYGIRNEPVSTVFLGGGTPSLLKPYQLEKIFVCLNDLYNISEDAEITMECNPGTLSYDNLIEYNKLGINRLSIGVQSFVPSELEFLQRIHSPEDVILSFEMARNAGFDNLNLDLIFSIPGQTNETLIYSLNKAIALEPSHISSYSLIFEPETPLYRDYLAGKVKQVDETGSAEFYNITMDMLINAGYEHYEVSNYAKDGKACKHNLIYWHGQEYFAFGPSAHGYLNGERYWNVRSLNLYNNHIAKGELPIKGSELLSLKDKMNERLFLELRADGIRIDEFTKDFGINLTKTLNGTLKYLNNEGFIHPVNGTISLTSKGYMLCDELAVNLITEIEKGSNNASTI